MYDLSSIKQTKGLHVAHLNTRSMVNKWDTIKAQFIDSKLHVLGLSETWLHDKLHSSLFYLNSSYDFIRLDRNWNDLDGNEPKRGGGLGCYINNNLQYSDMDFNYLNKSSKDIEIQWISIRQKTNKVVLIGNIYRPPQGNTQLFIDFLDNILSDLDLQKIEVILMGDYNIDVLNKKDVATIKLLDMIKQLGLRQLIKEPTHYSAIRDTCINLFITNSKIISHYGVSNVSLSDHQMILLTLKKLKIKKKKCDFTGRSYRNYNIDNFQSNLQNHSWEGFDNARTVTEKWKILINKITYEIDQVCPLRNFKLSKKRNHG